MPTRRAREPLAPIPTAYKVWLAGNLLSRLGDAALFFALGWVAAARGGSAAGLVLTSVAAPRTLLLLVGGAVADRVPVRRVLLVGDTCMFVVVSASAALAVAFDTGLLLLIGTGILVGIVDAFYMPAAGSLNRRLVPGEGLARAIAVNQSGGQLIALVGGPLGALIVQAGGYSAAAVFDACTFLIAVSAVMVIRRALGDKAADQQRGKVLAAAAEGVRLSVRDAVLRPALLLTAVVAAFCIPVGSLVIPILARQADWSAMTAGVVVGAQAVGATLVSLVVARRGVLRRIGLTSIVAVAPMCGGLLLLSMSKSPALAVAGAGVLGAGLGLFVSHLGPLMLAASPETHLARVQALITLVQSVSLLVTLNALGRFADVAGATSTALLSACVLAAAAALAFSSRPLRAVSRTVLAAK
jgi:predicted MFS family arabinose efflux permease